MRSTILKLLFMVHICNGFTVFKTTEVFTTAPVKKSESPKKEIPLSLAFKHKKTEDFVKRLEYVGESQG